jgi:hypothetical protein
MSCAAVEEFWSRCGSREPFPRDLERSIALALPVFLVKVPRLCVSTMRHWLSAHGCATGLSSLFTGPERRLRGSVIATAGQGIIFLDGSDPGDEQRFTLAHELAHFLLDYWVPRRLALEKLGPALVEVLNGNRTPTPEERLGALLMRAPLQTYTNLLGRGEGDAVLPADLDAVETQADRVALALLAPEEDVWRCADISASRFEERHSSLSGTLVEQFGLPSDIARLYSRLLLVSIGKGPTWAERLKIH